MGHALLNSYPFQNHPPFQKITIRKKNINKKSMAREGNPLEFIRGGLSLPPPTDKEIVSKALRAHPPYKDVPKLLSCFSTLGGLGEPPNSFPSKD